LPARLPANPREPLDIQSVRKRIARRVDDTKPPKDYQDGGDKRLGAELKLKAMKRIEAKYFLREWMISKIEDSRYYKESLESMHPKFRYYTKANKLKAYEAMTYAHPKLRVGTAWKRNAKYTVPNYPTSTRIMKPMEQKFLSAAMRRIQEDVAQKPFHRHGESSIVGSKNGEIVEFKHEPQGSVGFPGGLGGRSVTKGAGAFPEVRSRDPQNSLGRTLRRAPCN
jgi:hypothetical protein